MECISQVAEYIRKFSSLFLSSNSGGFLLFLLHPSNGGLLLLPDQLGGRCGLFLPLLLLLL